MDLIKIIAKNLNYGDIVYDKPIEYGSKFTEDLKMDSLDEINLIMECEDEYGVEISGDDIKSVKTVKDAFDFLVRLGVSEDTLKGNKTKTCYRNKMWAIDTENKESFYRIVTVEKVINLEGKKEHQLIANVFELCDAMEIIRAHNDSI